MTDDRVGKLNKNINYISPTHLRPTKEMLEKYQNIWLPLRKKVKDEKKNKKFFLLYGDFDIIEIKNDNIFPDTKINVSNPKSNNSSKKKSNSSTRKKQTRVVKGKKRTWTISNK